MGAWVMIELKNKSDQNILAKNNILKEKGSELFFLSLKEKTMQSMR